MRARRDAEHAPDRNDSGHVSAFPAGWHAPIEPARARRRRAIPLISLRPGIQAIRKRLGAKQRDITSQATDQWVIARDSRVEVRKAKFLPGQLDRIRGAEFGSVGEVIRDFIGGFDSIQSATIAYRLENVVLIDGVLYAGDATRHLTPRSSRLPARLAPRDIIRATMYESWLGNRWFGNWLSDDCLTYRLAESAGLPFTSEPATGHKRAYERRLDLRPTRMSSVRFEELVLFDDQSHNEHKRERANDLRHRLAGSEPRRHPGVFLLRGQTGAPRMLRDERGIAEHLAARRGFQILDPSTADVDEIIRVCGTAQVITGVEGSHLVHGLMVMPPEARALVVQPPARAVSALKLITDRQGQDYSFVVGVGSNEAFSADVEEIERTLDLA